MKNSQKIQNSTRIPVMNSLVNVLLLKGKTFNNFILRYEEVVDGKPEIRTGFLHNSQSDWIKSNFLKPNQIWLAKPDMQLEKGQWIFKLVCPVDNSENVFKRAVSTPEKIYLTTSDNDWNSLNTNSECVFEVGEYGEQMDNFFKKIRINSKVFFKFSDILMTLFENKSQFKKFQIKGGFQFTDIDE